MFLSRKVVNMHGSELHPLIFVQPGSSNNLNPFHFCVCPGMHVKAEELGLNFRNFVEFISLVYNFSQQSDH